MQYLTKYKCRYCGEVYPQDITTDKEVALTYLLETVLKSPNRMEIHFADGHYGISDLVGIEVVKEDG
jgi:hypothetical protein